MPTDQRAAVRAAYDRYITDYPAALWQHFEHGEPIDYGALDFWTFPMLFIIGEDANSRLAIVDQTAFDQSVRALYAEYHASGWGGGIRLDDAVVTMITDDLALIETEGSRLRRDGAIFNQWRACYWMRRSADDWRHIAVADTTAPRPDAQAWAGWLRSVWTPKRDD